MWLLGGALGTGVVAAVPGLVDFLASAEVRAHQAAWRHGLGNAAVLALTAVNVAIRLRTVQAAVLPWGMLLTALSAIVLLYTGWLGGELSYQHMVG